MNTSKRNTHPNIIAAAKANAARFWSDPVLRQKNLDGRKASQTFKKTHAATHLHTEEAKAQCQAARRKSKAVAANYKAGGKRLQDPAVKARRLKACEGSQATKAATMRMRSALVASPICRAGPAHHKGVRWHLRSPTNVEHHFTNLREFIRTHPELFIPADTEIRQPRGYTRAYAGISMLRPTAGKAKVPNTWKGWTWISYFEVFNNDTVDLLNRPTQPNRSV